MASILVPELSKRSFISSWMTDRPISRWMTWMLRTLENFGSSWN